MSSTVLNLEFETACGEFNYHWLGKFHQAQCNPSNNLQVTTLSCQLMTISTFKEQPAPLLSFLAFPNSLQWFASASTFFQDHRLRCIADFQVSLSSQSHPLALPGSQKPLGTFEPTLFLFIPTAICEQELPVLSPSSLLCCYTSTTIRASTTYSFCKLNGLSNKRSYGSME